MYRRQKHRKIKIEKKERYNTGFALRKNFFFSSQLNRRFLIKFGGNGHKCSQSDSFFCITHLFILLDDAVYEKIQE